MEIDKDKTQMQMCVVEYQRYFFYAPFSIYQQNTLYLNILNIGGVGAMVRRSP